LRLKIRPDRGRRKDRETSATAELADRAKVTSVTVLIPTSLRLPPPSLCISLSSTLFVGSPLCEVRLAP